MGLIKKKKVEEISELPRLPSLPELPSLPSLESDEYYSQKKELHDLPSFPGSEFGEKFSQRNIKNAVSGMDEEKDDLEDMPDFSRSRTIPSPPQLSKTRELMQEREVEKLIPSRPVAEEPIFIQIDKFEDGLQVFKRIKKNMEEIEVLLQETKDLKQKEDKELSLWEAEIQEMKNEIERVDKDIFEKI